jgi:hypothetical protein
MNEGLVILTWRCPACPRIEALTGLTVGELRHRVFSHIHEAHTALTDNNELIAAINRVFNAMLSERNAHGGAEPTDRPMLADLQLLRELNVA